MEYWFESYRFSKPVPVDKPPKVAKPSAFINLPAELRHIIYEFLFGEEELEVEIVRRDDVRDKLDFFQRFDIDLPPLSAAHTLYWPLFRDDGECSRFLNMRGLFSTCRFISEETLHFCYGRIKFTFVLECPIFIRPCEGLREVAYSEKEYPRETWSPYATASYTVYSPKFPPWWILSKRNWRHVRTVAIVLSPCQHNVDEIFGHHSLEVSNFLDIERRAAKTIETWLEEFVKITMSKPGSSLRHLRIQMNHWGSFYGVADLLTSRTAKAVIMARESALLPLGLLKDLQSVTLGSKQYGIPALIRFNFAQGLSASMMASKGSECKSLDHFKYQLGDRSADLAQESDSFVNWLVGESRAGGPVKSSCGHVKIDGPLW